MGRLLDALLGEPRQKVLREFDREMARRQVWNAANNVAREAAAQTPRGALTSSIRVEQQRRNLVDGPHATPPDPEGVPDLDRVRDRLENGCGDPGPMPFPLPVGPGLLDGADPDNPVVQVVRQHAERAFTGGHEWVEVDLAGTGQVVAWYCRKCDKQEYAEGW